LLSAFADDFHPLVPAGSPWTATANPGVTLEGGIFYGVCPGEASFGVDVRTVPGMTLEALQSQVASFVSAACAADPELVVEVEWPPGTSWFPPSSVDPTGPLLRAARSAVTDTLHEQIPDGIFPGGTEGAIWAQRGIPVLPALGPGRLTEAHRPNEALGVGEIVSACQIYALTALRFFTDDH
jgi:succinyl-diaminopimelate desuccinylase